MRSIGKLLRRAALIVAIASPLAANATVPIAFDPTGNGGTTGGTLSVGTFDWAVNSALAVAGNPAGGLTQNYKFTVLSQARLGSLLSPTSSQLAIPATKEFTFVAGYGEIVTQCVGTPCSLAALGFDGSQPNFFEIWVKDKPAGVPVVADALAGTGYNTGTRILYGQVSDASGSFGTGGCPNGGAMDLLDQFNGDNWAGQLTLCGAGGSVASVQIVFIDDQYFPGFRPEQLASLKIRFGSQNNLPFTNGDPAKRFIGDQSQGPERLPILGPVNGLAGIASYDFEFYADASNSFEVGQTVEGACRVTYGGNDRNGNIAQNSFGQACMKTGGKGNEENCYTFGGQVGAPTANPALGGPFGEHTHHNVSGPAGDFVFHAGTHSSPKTTRITATACKDPGACRQAEANAGFKQIDFEGTGSFRTLDPVAQGYLAGKAGHPVLPDNQDARIYYFRVDMDDTGEPGNKASKNRFDITAATNFFNADQNLPLATPDPLVPSCNTMADVYQFYICADATPCEEAQAIYKVRAFLTGGNIQLHKVIK